ncbi:MAG: hypothetical protein H6744_18945, partial [Deltaproteobacteria bacterium]|nr:hypothetical protein [Deltaproteobacteria bacterium]
ETPRSRQPCQKRRARAASWAAALVLLLAGGHARADEATVHRYQGAFWAIQAHTGLVMRRDPRPGEGVGAALGGSLRLATVLSLLDIQASVFAARYETRALDDARVRVTRWSLGFEGHLHPLFLGTIYNNRLWYWLAGIYGSFGVDLDLTRLAVSGPGSLRDRGLAWHLGVGMDVPVTDPNRGAGFWLGVAFRAKFLDVDSGGLGLGSFNERMITLTFAYRNNNIFFARLPPPTELRLEEPQLPRAAPP